MSYRDKEPIMSQSDLIIRPMGIDDLAPIFHLGEQLFTSKDYPNLYRTWDEYEVTSSFHTDVETCYVAEAGGEVAGFLLGTVIEKQRSRWKYGHLVWLGVSPDYQRFGIASRLFEKFRQHMIDMDVRMLMVDTQMSNISAIQFFEKKGFGNPTEHVYMTLNLENE